MPQRWRRPLDIDARLQHAVQSFWTARKRNLEKQKQRGKVDAGTRGAVTAGTQMGALELLVTDILREAGLKDLDIKTRKALELPGYYRAEKKWDLIIVSEGQLVTAMEFKSQVGPSFGNNFNNRSEEVLGSATCIWTAFREGRFGVGTPAPFIGYVFLLEECPKVHKDVRNREPYFDVDPVFKGQPIKKKGSDAFTGVSYSRRYELLCRRLVLERLYSAACLLLSTNAEPTQITQPAEDLTFKRFAAALRGHVVAFLDGRTR
jgi:hypothetical protein